MKPSRGGPLLIDQVAPLLLRKPRAGPLLEPNEVIACALNSIPYEFWKQKLSEDSIVVHTILDALKKTGWKIEPL
jgi:hypothetical protein